MRDTDQDRGQDRRRRYTVPEAAEVLGITHDAVRKRITRHTIEHERDGEGRVHVYLDGSETRREADKDADRDELLTVYRRQVEMLRDQLAGEREANRENRRIIAGLIQRVPELEPASPAQNAQEPSERRQDAGEGYGQGEAPAGPQTPQERPQRSFWSRIFGGS